MKVLFVVTAYPRHEGDVITPWMGETIERLRQAGTDVEVLAPAFRGSASSVINGVRVHRFRYAPAALETLTHDMPALDRIAGSPLMASLLPAYLMSGSLAAARIARDGNFDVVHAFWPIPHGIFGISAKRASGAALVSTFFSSELNWKSAARSIAGPILRKVVAASDAITVISSYTAARLREHAPGTTAVTIPFGAAAVKKASQSFRRARKREDEFNLLFVGRLVRRKGVDVLLRAAGKLAADSRLRLTIVGGGPELSSLQRVASRMNLGDRVKFVGVVDSERIDTLFRECDALVLPAIVMENGETEGLGVVLIEAMGYGKPVIATSAGGIPDIVTDGDTGLLVPPGDVDALARAISHAMDEPDELAEIADRGTAFAETAFGWDAIVASLQNVYESAIRETRLAR